MRRYTSEEIYQDNEKRILNICAWQKRSLNRAKWFPAVWILVSLAGLLMYAASVAEEVPPWGYLMSLLYTSFGILMARDSRKEFIASSHRWETLLAECVEFRNQLNQDRQS